MQAVVNTLFTLKDVENYYLQFYLNIAHMLQPHSIYNTGELIDQIRTYMQKNYQKKQKKFIINYQRSLCVNMMKQVQ